MWHTTLSVVLQRCAGASDTDDKKSPWKSPAFLISFFLSERTSHRQSSSVPPHLNGKRFTVFIRINKSVSVLASSHQSSASLVGAHSSSSVTHCRDCGARPGQCVHTLSRAGQRVEVQSRARAHPPTSTSFACLELVMQLPHEPPQSSGPPRCVVCDDDGRTAAAAAGGGGGCVAAPAVAAVAAVAAGGGGRAAAAAAACGGCNPAAATATTAAGGGGECTPIRSCIHQSPIHPSIDLSIHRSTCLSIPPSALR